MATRILTSATPEELAVKFPMTCRPFVVWYNPDPEVSENPFVVNGENCEACKVSFMR